MQSSHLISYTTRLKEKLSIMEANELIIVWLKVSYYDEKYSFSLRISIIYWIGSCENSSLVEGTEYRQSESGERLGNYQNNRQTSPKICLI